MNASPTCTAIEVEVEVTIESVYAYVYTFIYNTSKCSCVPHWSVNSRRDYNKQIRVIALTGQFVSDVMLTSSKCQLEQGPVALHRRIPARGEHCNQQTAVVLVDYYCDQIAEI